MGTQVPWRPKASTQPLCHHSHRLKAKLFWYSEKNWSLQVNKIEPALPLRADRATLNDPKTGPLIIISNVTAEKEGI